MALNQLGLGFVFTAEDLASGVIHRVGSEFQRLDSASSEAGKTVGASLRQFGQGIAILGAGVAGLMMVDRAVEAAGRFSAAIAEVSTLVDEATFSTADMRRVTLELAATYGGSAAGQAKGLYQTISAGITDAAKATDLLRVANELAVGGVTDTFTAVDALTNVVNAYAASGAQARDVSDAFFVAIRAGKTTARELAGTIGRVAPTAASMGITFSDLLAAIAAITTQGLNTEETVTGIKAALANVVRPTAQAQKEAARLGIQFNLAALRAKGLTGFLDSITSSANFNADSFSKLFASVEGFNAITALAANNSAQYRQILGQMASRAGATRAAFDKMADTLKFQESRFEALRENALIVIGQALEPLAKALVKAANAVLEAFTRIPRPIRDFAVRAFAAVSAVLVLVGGVLAAKAAVALLVAAFEAVGVSLAGVLSALAPVLVALGFLALTVAGFAIAVRHDVGGLGTFLSETWERLKLLFQGLAQLFEEGGFSGAVMAELDKAENAGVKQFAIRVFQIVFRIQRFFEGLAGGFGAAIQRARPVFEAFVGALRELGEAFGIVGTASANAVAGIGSDKFARTGASIGAVLAQLVTIIVDGLTIVVRVVTGIINGVREAFAFFRPVFEFARQAIGFVGEELRGLISDVTGVNDQAREGGSVWRDIGEVLGWVAGILGGVLAGAIGVVALALRTVIAIVRAVIHAFVWLGEFIGETAARIYLFFTETIPRVLKTVVGAVKAFFQPVVDFITGVVDSIRNVLDKVIAFIGRLVAKIPSRFRPAFLDTIVDAGEAAQERISVRTGGLSPSGVLGVPAGFGALPAASEVRARGQISDAEIDAIVQRGVALSEGRPLQANVTLNVDGETLARASARADRSAAARSFIPVPVPG